MKKRIPTLLATLIGSALYSPLNWADLREQCLTGIPVFKRPLVTGSPNTLPVTINADQASGHYPDSATFSGNVKIEQGNGLLLADKVNVQQKQGAEGKPLRTATAEGNVHYDDNQIVLNGPKAWTDLNTKDTDLWQGDYQLVGRQGRGQAALMKQRDQNRYTILENGTFTSCLPGDNSWSVDGSEVIYDRQEEVAEIWNARFKVGPVPIFYSPYLQLPVGNKRRSGFLIPDIRYSKGDGLELFLPWYWNIAPNYDATFTPHYISKRGLQLQNEFRYLTPLGTGLMELDWLPHDKRFKTDHADADRDKRWLFYWQHNGVFDKVWRFNVDYTKVSDIWYFSDLESRYGSTTDGYATQKASAGYADENWDIALQARQFQVFSQMTNRSVYRAQPQLDIDYYKNELGPFDLHVYSQVARFTNVNGRYPDATRWHIAPELSLPLSNRWGSLNTDVKLLATHFQQSDIDTYNSTHADTPLKKSVNRVLPQVKVDGKLVFDRQIEHGLPGYTHTLEPRVQYQYTPYRDQSDIYIYDTTLLQTDYSGLFRDRKYSGLDRISSSNQIAAGLTTRFYDPSMVERFNLSVGQIYYLDKPRTGDDFFIYNQSEDTGSVVWAADTWWKMTDHLGLRGGIQYDSRLDSVALGDAVLEYRQDAERLVQLNYRYASTKYIQAMLPDIRHPGYQQGLSQVGGIASWPVMDRLALVGSYYYDTKARQPAQQLLGLQYNTCCWSVRLGYERKITDWNANTKNSIYDNKVMFTIMLRGLSSDYSLGSRDMLQSGILPYQRTF